MKKIGNLNINLNKEISKENLLILKGGVEPGGGTCAFMDPDGYVYCNLSKSEALFMYEPYGSGSGAHWCCDSCSSTQWWINACGTQPE